MKITSDIQESGVLNMEIEITIKCTICSNKRTIPLKRIVNHNDGKVYDDYLSLEDSINNDGNFKTDMTNPEGFDVICGQCGHRHEVLI